MSHWHLPWTGACRCGQVRVRVNAPPLLTSACHCNGCQRMSASAFSLTVTLPSKGFEVTSGEPVIGGLHGPTRHYFCPHCKSWLFTRPDGYDQFVNLRAPVLDERRWFTPFIEVYTRDKLPWAATPAVHRYETEPPIEEYGLLLAEFAQHQDAVDKS